MKATVILGLVLCAAMAGLAYRAWGEQAALAAAVLGAAALVIQVVAVALVRTAKGAPLAKFMVRWGAGMGLRLLGIVLLALLAGLDPAHFPPGPAAAGFLGVLLPLLFLEARVAR